MSGGDVSIELADRLAIHELIALHGHLCDSGELNRLDEFLSEDAVYDVSAFGGEPLIGVAAVIAAARSLGEANPLAHHVTNVVIDSVGSDGVEVRSKGFAVGLDGTTSSVVYEDLVRHTSVGWRVVRRTILPRRRPLEL